MHTCTFGFSSKLQQVDQHFFCRLTLAFFFQAGVYDNAWEHLTDENKNEPYHYGAPVDPTAYQNEYIVSFLDPTRPVQKEHVPSTTG
jgi:hypothetical protein